MCLSIPMQVVENDGDGDFAWAERPGRRERLNMMLVGPQAVGTWVLAAQGLAKDVVSEQQRLLIEDALAAVAEALEGDYDSSRHFTDLR